MHHPYRRYRFLLPCILALIATSAWGGEIQQLPEPGSDQLGPGSPGVMATCTVGETRAATVNVGYGAAPGVEFYTLLNPADCSACPSGLLQLRAANFRARTPSGVCTFTIEVSIVEAKAGPACTLEPDPSHLVCAPVTASITSPSTLTFTGSVPLPTNCCLSRPAFLRIRTVSAGSCGTVFWGHTSPCVPCRSFVQTTSTPLTEACALGLGNPTQSVDADCCDPTPGLHGTWGQLKMLYR